MKAVDTSVRCSWSKESLRKTLTLNRSNISSDRRYSVIISLFSSSLFVFLLTWFICMSALCLDFLYCKLLTPMNPLCACKHAWQCISFWYVVLNRFMIEKLLRHFTRSNEIWACCIIRQPMVGQWIMISLFICNILEIYLNRHSGFYFFKSEIVIIWLILF